MEESGIHKSNQQRKMAIQQKATEKHHESNLDNQEERTGPVRSSIATLIDRKRFKNFIVIAEELLKKTKPINLAMTYLKPETEDRDHKKTNKKSSQKKNYSF